MNLLRTLARFVKLEHTIFSLPLVFAGAYLGAGRQIPALPTLVLVALAATGGRILGMAMNRILDREMDALNARTKGRELPAGVLSLRQAWLIAGIGLVLGLGPLAAYVAVRGQVAGPGDLLCLAGFTFFWISGYDIIYALQDEVFDRTHGVHSIPGRFGNRLAQGVALLTHLAAFSLLLVYALHYAAGGWVWAPIAVCGAALALSYHPAIPLPARFFPLSAVAGIAGSLIVYL